MQRCRLLTDNCQRAKATAITRKHESRLPLGKISAPSLTKEADQIANPVNVSTLAYIGQLNEAFTTAAMADKQKAVTTAPPATHSNELCSAVNDSLNAWPTAV